MLKFSWQSAFHGALLAALVCGPATLAWAQEDNSSDGVVQIGRSDKEGSQPKLPPPGEGADLEQPVAPKYWIGLLGGPIPADHPLRAHLDLPENQGLIVAEIVPDSPAAKAGLKKHDILLRANDTELREMQDLVEMVLSEGPKKGQITLDVFRHGKRETIYLTPEERPANAPVPQTGVGGGIGGGGIGGGGGGFGGEMPVPGELFEQFGGRLPMEFRNFGPGVIVGGGGQGFAGMPSGVSISVEKRDNEQPNITVKRGEETWKVTGDDPESLKQLPDDLRPFVERMLKGGMNIRMQEFNRRLAAPGEEDRPLRERLERMEKRLEELQKRLSSPEDEPAAQPAEQDSK